MKIVKKYKFISDWLYPIRRSIRPNKTVCMSNFPDQPPVNQLHDFINRATREVKTLNTNNLKGHVPEVKKDLGKLIDFLNEIKEKL